MAYPTKYTRQYDFQSYQNANPTRPLPADRVNADLNLVQISTNEIVEFLKGIARDDGKIANASVDFEQLTTQVRAMLGDETAVQTITDMRDETVANANLTAADVESTHADVASTNADVALTHADVVTTGNDAATATAQAGAAAASATAAAASATVVSGFKFLFDTGTSMADPGAGNVRANNAAVASATALAFSKNSADAGGPDVSDFLATWGASTNGTKRGSIVIRKIGAPNVFAIFDVAAAVVDNGAWLQVTVGYVSGAGALALTDPVSVQWERAGDKGSDGFDASVDYTPTGNWTFNPASGDAITVNPASGTDAKAFKISQVGPAAYSGAGPFIYNQFDIESNINNTGTDNRVMGFFSKMTVGGPGVASPQGIYNGWFQLNHTGNSPNVTGNLAALVAFAYSNASTDPTAGLFGFNPVAICDANSNIGEIIGTESDVQINTGGKALRRAAFRAINAGTTKATLLDSAFSVASDTAGGEFQHLIALSHEFGHPPIDATGDFFYSDHDYTIGSFAKLSNIDFTDHIFDFKNFKVTGAGALTASAMNVKGADGTVATGVIDSFGTGFATAFSAMLFRRSNGSSASPSGLKNQDIIGQFGAVGYGASGYSPIARAQVRLFAAGDWNDTAQGAGLLFFTTPAGGTETNPALTIADTGILGFNTGIVANGSVATTMTSLGPTGSHTTVQEWLKVTNASGITRFIPLY